MGHKAVQKVGGCVYGEGVTAGRDSRWIALAVRVCVYVVAVRPHIAKYGTVTAGVRVRP